MSSSRRTRPELGDVCNVQPQTREQRNAEQHREDLEKMRLRNRKEGFYSYQEGGITQPTSSLGYISEAERFITDVAAVAKSEREADHAKRDQMVQAKRANKANREEQRWQSIEAEAEFDERRAQEMREVGAFSKANKTSMPYDPINLKYGEGRDGECLRYSDDALKYRSALRAEHLQRRMNGGYNPITGAELQRVPVPERPEAPAFMQQGGGR